MAEASEAEALAAVVPVEAGKLRNGIMSETFFDERHFQKKTSEDLQKGEYDTCTFTNCNFTNADLSSCRFIDCEFIECDLSNCNLTGTSFQHCDFSNCKMIGLNFEKCEPFGFSINAVDSILNHATFYQVKLPNCNFSNSKLIGADFTEADVKNVHFQNCDLESTVFQNSNLEKADFRGAMNFQIDPEKNTVKGAKFSANSLAGLLGKYQLKINP